MDYIKTFSTSLQAEGKSANTIKNYLVSVKQFLKFHKDNLHAITQESIDTFFSGFNSRNQTQNLKKTEINKFLTFLYERKQVNKRFKIKSKGITLTEPEYLSKAEQYRFFEVLQDNPLFLRDYTLFATMLYTGMRISEVLNIRLKDIQDDHIIIRDSKTGPGKVYLRKKFKPMLDEYISVVRAELRHSDFIFQSNRKRRLTERTVQKLIKKYLRLAGIQKDLTPHSLRHTFAARLRQSGSDIEIIQRTLRHKHIQSTMRYSHIKDEDLKQAVERSVTMPSSSKKK